MLKFSPRPFPVAIGLVLLALIRSAIWLALTLGWFSPPKTKFGWQATMTNVAGDGAKGRLDGAQNRARFGDPFAVVMDANGALYVADADRIRKVDPDGNVTTLPGAFDTPSGLALDRAGNLFVADTGANAIRRITPAGDVTTIAGDGTAGYRDGPAAQARFNGPIGVAADDKGNVYVADTYNDRIRVIAADGQVRTLAGGEAPGFADGRGSGAAFDTPTGLTLDPHGQLLVADSGNDAIRKVLPDGRVTTLARTEATDGGGLLQGAVGLAATWDGYVYVASYRRGRIVEMSPAGELRILAGPGSTIDGNAALPLLGPAGLTVDRAGALYVADASAYAIRKLTPRGRDPGPPPAIPQPAPPSLVAASVVPWPVGPQLAWHEVVGDMGEVRGNYDGESRDHLHAGLDISAPVGATVFASADENVRDPMPNWDVEGLSEGLRIDELTYIHMRVGRTASGDPLDPSRFQIVRDAEGHVVRVRVKRGTHFRVGDALGTINRMAHVHLELGPPRGKINALFLKFPGFGDHVAPHIDDVYLIDAAGQRLADKQNGRLVVAANAGSLGIVVEAWDQVDDNAARRRLGLYRAGFQILKPDGTPAPGFAQPRVTIQFDRMPLGANAAKIAYAPASGDTVHSDQRTRMQYVVTNIVRDGRIEPGGWTPASLPPGDYIVRIYAADIAGNIASAGRDLPITIR
ncbi:gluconolaconase [Sphingomonas panacisoli]|uniref:Gluconolaconase n=1 Tax=Sphingomonas panacisoli TaxID=1813879 RepID=A0A5B8LJH0_9SPHN|nr:gluconolaconase [Sphingomonas panacisoli]QDZ08251.1 gluconolaconase [Sphingomonas panacisoli]